MLNRWTRLVLRHRGVVLIAWLALAVLGLATSGALESRLSTSLAVPGSPSQQANAILAAHFGENVEGSFTVVVPDGHARAGRVEELVARAVRVIPTGRVLQSRVIGGVTYVEADSRWDLTRAAAWTPSLRRALAARGLAGAMVTGPAALQYDVTPVLRGDLRRGEALALALAALILVATLGLCGAVLVPFVVALATIATSLALVYLLSHVVAMVLYVPNVLELIGLGLAIDYSLLIVHRYRAEMRAGASTTEAVVTTMERAGRTVVISGMAVGVGLATLLLEPVAFLRSLGAAGVVVPLVSVGAALTLQPVLLSWLGARGLRSVGPRGVMGERDRLRVGWTASTRAVLRAPRRFALAALVVVALCATSLWWLQLTPGSLDTIPPTLASARANAFIQRHVGIGVITPLQVVVIAPVGETWRSRALQGIQTRLATVILSEPAVSDVAIGIRAPYVDASGRYTQIFVVASPPFGAAASQRLVAHIRDVDVAAAALPPGFRVLVGGAAAQGVDFLTRAYGAFVWLVALALALALLIVWRAFDSLALAVASIVFDLLSVAAGYGLMVAVFRFGFAADVLGTYRTAQIEGWVPIFIFAVLFGLSMDYEVFIVRRVREARLAGQSHHDAIVAGLADTGGVVSAAAVVMIAALSGLVAGHVAGLQELGVGLAGGVLVDATLVRGLIVPATLALWGPGRPRTGDPASPRR